MTPSNQVKRLYTKRALFYQRLFVDFLGWGKELERFFQSTSYLQPGFKVLDAGCGTGIVTIVLYKIARRKGYEGLAFHAFDLTPAMLEIFREWVVREGATNIELRQADVLQLPQPGSLPSDWKAHDLVITSAMLEYLPRSQVKQALRNLKQLLREGGILLVFVTKRNFLTGLLGKRWWKTNVYIDNEIRGLLLDVGFGKVKPRRLSSWWSGYILVVEAS
jgi:ubiquinone/menaquinone biosynthesis C-methylase UbiE